MGGSNEKKNRLQAAHLLSSSPIEDDGLVTWAVEVVSSKAATSIQSPSTSSTEEDDETRQELGLSFGSLPDSCEIARRKRSLVIKEGDEAAVSPIQSNRLRHIAPLSAQLRGRISKAVQGSTGHDCNIETLSNLEVSVRKQYEELRLGSPILNLPCRFEDFLEGIKEAQAISNPSQTEDGDSITHDKLGLCNYGVAAQVHGCLSKQKPIEGGHGITQRVTTEAFYYGPDESVSCLREVRTADNGRASARAGKNIIEEGDVAHAPGARGQDTVSSCSGLDNGDNDVSCGQCNSCGNDYAALGMSKDNPGGGAHYVEHSINSGLLSAHANEARGLGLANLNTHAGSTMSAILPQLRVSHNGDVAASASTNACALPQSHLSAPGHVVGHATAGQRSKRDHFEGVVFPLFCPKESATPKENERRQVEGPMAVDSFTHDSGCVIAVDVGVEKSNLAAFEADISNVAAESLGLAKDLEKASCAAVVSNQRGTQALMNLEQATVEHDANISKSPGPINININHVTSSFLHAATGPIAGGPYIRDAATGQNQVSSAVGTMAVGSIHRNVHQVPQAVGPNAGVHGPFVGPHAYQNTNVTGPNAKPTWSGLLKPTVHAFKLNHIDLGTCRHDKKLRVPSSITDTGCQDWHNTLVGFFLDRKLPYSLVHKATTKFWENVGLIDILATDQGTYYFKFISSSTMEAVLEGGPWNVAGKPIVLRKWEPHLSIEKDRVSKIPIWVHFFNIPLEYWTPEGLSYIASMVGKPLQVDKMTATRRRITYARICIEVDAKEDWLTSFDLEAEGSPVGNAPITIRLEYQWTPTRCSICKSFGHDCNKKTPVHQTYPNHNSSPRWKPVKFSMNGLKVSDTPDEDSHGEGEWKVVGGKGKVKANVNMQLGKSKIDECDQFPSLGVYPSSSARAHQMVEESVVTTIVPTFSSLDVPDDPKSKSKAGQVVPTSNRFLALPSADEIVGAMDHTVLSQDANTESDSVCVEDSVDYHVEIVGRSRASNSLEYSRQRKKDAKMRHNGNRPKGRHKL